MPPEAEGEVSAFAPDEIVITLHDEGPEGRIFRMKAW